MGGYSFLYVRLDYYTANCQPLKHAVFRIRIGFNQYPDSDPDLNADPDPDPDPESQTSADPDLNFSQPLPSQSWILTMKNVLYVSSVICQKTYLRSFESHFERLEIRFICQFWSVSLLLDPDSHSQYGSGSVSRRENSRLIRIQNT